MYRASFEGGPYDGCEMGIAGALPGFLMLMDAPPGATMSPIVVGADFNDYWPGQQRYDLLTWAQHGGDGTATYRHAGAAA